VSFSHISPTRSAWGQSWVNSDFVTYRRRDQPDVHRDVLGIEYPN